MKWTNEDVKLVEKFIQIRNKGYYANGSELTEVYNRVLEKNVPPTNCGSCIRARITELENALNQFKKQMELSGFTNANDYLNEVNAIKEEIENKAISSSPEAKTKDEVMKERMAKVRAARKPKNDASEVTQQPE